MISGIDCGPAFAGMPLRLLPAQHFLATLASMKLPKL
jgi:hypothetical protein